MHSNPIMTEVVAAYAMAIQTLIKNFSDEKRAQLAFDQAKELAEKC